MIETNKKNVKFDITTTKLPALSPTDQIGNGIANLASSVLPAKLTSQHSEESKGELSQEQHLINRHDNVVVKYEEEVALTKHLSPMKIRTDGNKQGRQG